MNQLALTSLLTTCIATAWSTAATIPVTSLSNSGPGTLREAIALANQTPEEDTITFPSFADQVQRTIVINSPFSVTAPLTIDGPGSNLLTIDGQSSTRLFALSGSTTAQPHRILGLTLENGSAQRGGANIRCFGSLDLIDCTLTGAQATAVVTSRNSIDNADGGALFHSGGNLLIQNCLISGNSTVGGFSQGGGFYTENGQATVRDSRITSNTTNGPVAEGGGIGSRSQTLLENCEISGNETLASSSGGGGMYSDTDCTLRQCTFSGNIVGAVTGETGYSVGGAFANVGGSATFEHCTITENIAPPGMGQGAGISSLTRGIISFTSCIVSGNGTSDLDQPGSRVINYRDNGFNVFGTVRNTNLNSPANRSTTSVYEVSDPVLSSLSFHGGPTQSHVPLPGSPVINAGSATSTLISDQRGIDFPRINDSQLDAGSIERQTSIDTDADGIPDAVESTVNGLDVSSGDLDRDGVSDSIEYGLLGVAAITDPSLSPQLIIRPTATINSYELSFPKSTNRQYRLLTNDDLSSTRTPVTTNFTSFAEAQEGVLPAASASSQSFYFLEAIQPQEPSNVSAQAGTVAGRG